MAKLNRIRIVLAERDLNNKWLADKLGKDQATISIVFRDFHRMFLSLHMK